MNIPTFFAIAAALGAVFALVCGIAAMVSDGEVMHRRSEIWMGWRVAFQGTALLLAALILLNAAHAAPPARDDCVYDYQLITDQECRTYRAKVLGARSEEERLVLHDELHKLMDARAQERRVAPGGNRGIPVPSGDQLR